MTLEELKRRVAMLAVRAFNDIDRTRGTHNESYHEGRFEAFNEVLDLINEEEEQTHGA